MLDAHAQGSQIGGVVGETTVSLADHQRAVGAGVGPHGLGAVLLFCQEAHSVQGRGDVPQHGVVRGLATLMQRDPQALVNVLELLREVGVGGDR